MSTTAYRSTHSSRSFTQQHVRKSSTMTNKSTRYNTIHPPVPPIRESLSTNSITLPPSTSVSIHNSSNNKVSTQPYTFSNPPRELQRQSIQNMKHLRNNRLRQRVASAPDENSCQNSPRSVINHQKPSSANESSTPRSHDDNNPIPLLPLNQLYKRDEQQKSSLNALMKTQVRSNVPRSVQNRRIILLFRRFPPSTSPLISPRQQQNSSPIKPNIISNDVHQVDKKTRDEIQHFANNASKLRFCFVFYIDLFYSISINRFI